MRRMRSSWQYGLFVVPILVVAVGMTYVTRHRSDSRNWFQSRTPAAVPEAMNNLKQKIAQKIARASADEDTPEEDLRLNSHIPMKAAEERAPASADVCHTEEFAGHGPDDSHVSKKDWDHVMDEFHDAKALLNAWLQLHKTQFTEKTFAWMNGKITEAKLQRPPSQDEPDLAWRGIGVAADLHSDAPLIRVGGGFARWVAENPRRARFELARLLAQSWAPCELNRVDSSSPWKKVVACVDLGTEVDASKACAGDNSYSEAGWAVSSAVAAAASPPGCRIPAFEKASVSQCIKNAGVGL